MPATSPWVRVLDKDTGHKISIRQAALKHGNYEPLKDDNGGPAQATDHNGDPLPPEYAAKAEPASKYDGMKVDQLKDEIAKRNKNRDETSLIVAEAPGNKPELIAALEADDAPSAS